jgi:pilus assembly protein Flp/PilA
MRSENIDKQMRSEANAILILACFDGVHAMRVHGELGAVERDRIIMMTIARKFLKDDNGATAIEYGLIAALIAVVIVGGVTLIGTNLSALFTSVAGSV